MLAELFSSKKFLVFLGGVLFAVGNAIGRHWDVSLDRETVDFVLGLVATYIVGQGLADHGKAAAKIHVVGLEAPAPTGDAQ